MKIAAIDFQKGTKEIEVPDDDFPYDPKEPLIAIVIDDQTVLTCCSLDPDLEAKPSIPYFRILRRSSNGVYKYAGDFHFAKAKCSPNIRLHFILSSTDPALSTHRNCVEFEWKAA